MAYNRQKQVKPKGGFYPETKVYFDGSHYIAIPHTERPYRPRRKPVEEIITVHANAPPMVEEIADVQREISEQKNSAPAEEADALAEELAGMDIFGGVIGYVTELQDKAVVFE